MAGIQRGRLYRSRTNRMISGVCGGVAEWVGMDVSLVRVLWAVITLIGGIVPGVLLYIVLMLVLPEADEPASDT